MDELLHGVMEQEGEATVKLLDEELQATGCTLPPSQPGNQCLSTALVLDDMYKMKCTVW